MAMNLVKFCGCGAVEEMDSSTHSNGMDDRRGAVMTDRSFVFCFELNISVRACVCKILSEIFST
jgi:hypothetical protein